MLTQINKWFYNNSFQSRLATGLVKKRKVEEDGEENEHEVTEDEESFERHCSSGVARPLKMVGHKYGKWSSK